LKTSTSRCGRSRGSSRNWSKVKEMELLWSHLSSHLRKICKELWHSWVMSTPKQQISSLNRPWLLFRALLLQLERNLSFIRIPLPMDSSCSAVKFLWTITRRRKKWHSTLSHLDQLKHSCINVRTNSMQVASTTSWRTMKNSVSLLLMVVVLSLPPFKVTWETSFKKLQSSCQKNTAEVVNPPTDLQDWEKKKDIIT